jgi:hypothetical protein
MHPDDLESVLVVAFKPLLVLFKSPYAVDAGVFPEVDEHYFPCKLSHGKRP